MNVNHPKRAYGFTVNTIRYYNGVSISVEAPFVFNTILQLSHGKIISNGSKKYESFQLQLENTIFTDSIGPR